MTFFVGDMFSLSLWIWEISRCYSSGAIVTGPALSHFANLLDSSKFFISPSMPAFFDVMFTLNIQLWNTIRMRWDITLLQFRRHRNFHLFNCGIPFTAAALCASSFSLVKNYWSFSSSKQKERSNMSANNSIRVQGKSHYSAFFSYTRLDSKNGSDTFYGFHLCWSVAEIFHFWGNNGDNAVPLCNGKSIHNKLYFVQNERSIPIFLRRGDVYLTVKSSD